MSGSVFIDHYVAALQRAHEGETHTEGRERDCTGGNFNFPVFSYNILFDCQVQTSAESLPFSVELWQQRKQKVKQASLSYVEGK